MLENDIMKSHKSNDNVISFASTFNPRQIELFTTIAQIGTLYMMKTRCEI